MESKIDFRLNFVDILTPGSAGPVVSDLHLIEWDKAIEFVLLGLRLKYSLLGNENVNEITHVRRREDLLFTGWIQLV